MQEFDRVPRQVAAPLMRDLMSSDSVDRLTRSSCPLLYIHALVPADLGRLRDLRPDALVGEVVGSGHWAMLSVPAQVNAMIDRFLEIVAAGSGPA